jgi:hypothetical protein
MRRAVNRRLSSTDCTGDHKIHNRVWNAEDTKYVVIKKVYWYCQNIRLMHPCSGLWKRARFVIKWFTYR